MKVTKYSCLLIALVSILLSIAIKLVAGSDSPNLPQEKIQDSALEARRNKKSPVSRSLQEFLPIISAVATSYRGNRFPDNAIDEDTLSRWASLPTDNEWIYVELDRAYQLTNVVLEWGIAYGKDYDIEVSDDATNWVVVAEIRDEAAFRSRSIPLASQPTASYVRINGISSDTQRGYSLRDIKVKGFEVNPTTLTPTPAPTMIFSTITPTAGSVTQSFFDAKIIGATSSSTAFSFSGIYKDSNVYDGRNDTLWACARKSDKQWIYVELDRFYPLSSVVLNWGSAYGKNYNIEVWDGREWIIAARIRGQTSAGIRTISLDSYPVASHVRVRGKTRGTPHCYSLYEITVKTSAVDSTPMPVAPTPAPETSDPFLMRLYWEKGYVWQLDRNEQFWCMACYPSCIPGAEIRVEWCATNTTRWQFAPNSEVEGNQIKVNGTNLCIERKSGISLFRRNRVPLSVKSCDSQSIEQRWKAMLGSFRENKFDIGPVGWEGWCISQPHQPKEFETVYMINCANAHNATTGFWTKF